MNKIEKVRDIFQKVYNEHGFESLVGQALGRASTCWENMSGTGEFESDTAKELYDLIMKFHQQEVEKAVRVALNRVQLPHPIDAHSAKSGLFDPTKEEGD